MNTAPNPSFLARHEFLIRRLHSLSGLIPVGAFMCIHLLANASILNGPGSFQKIVYQIHSAGRVLWLIEWIFIFIPILFHAIVGVAIVRGGVPNNSSYAYSGNVRYTLQRATGMIAFVFIIWHVFHMHGWFHFPWWEKTVAEPLLGAQFAAYSAASTAAEAMRGRPFVIAAYFIGVTCCVFHLANGLWTMGITWGVWTSPQAQRRGNVVCGVFGIGLLMIGLSAWGGFSFQDDEAIREAQLVEDAMYRAKIESRELDENEARRKRAEAKEDAETAYNAAPRGGAQP